MTPRERVLNALAGRPVDRVPWVEHGLNPLEPGGMDLVEVRRRCPDATMIGNVAVGLLAAGSPEQVRQAVRDAFAIMNHNHRFIPASGNSIPSYADPANVRAMVEEIHRLAASPPA